MSSTSPYLTDGPDSPLDALAVRALRRYGETAVSTTDADVMLNFVDYANEVIDDIHQHPYFSGDVVAYFKHPSESRPIPDHVLVSALLFRHARDQRSKMTARYEADYYQKLNQLMTFRKFGPNPSFVIQAIDRPEER